MKKLLTSFAIAIIFSIAAQAQDSSIATVPVTTTAVGSTQETNPNMKERRAANQEKYKDAFKEQKARKEQRREVMKKLSPEQKAAVKQEIARHRQVMKQYGFGDDMITQVPQENSAQ